MSEQNLAADMPVVRDPAHFDLQSGDLLERLVFNNRAIVLLLCVAATLVLGYFAAHLRVNASFERMIPTSSPIIQNYLKYKSELPGLGNTIRIVVENRSGGDIFDPAYLEVLRKANDAAFLLPGVDRSWMKSLWMPIVRWRQVTEEGVIGGPVMPPDYNGSPASIEQLRANVARAGVVGSLVSNDMRSSMIIMPVLDRHPHTGQPLDYGEVSELLESQIRVLEDERTGIYIVGFAKIVGDLIAGLYQVMLFFGASVLIAGIFVFVYTRCVRSTLMLVALALVGVVWLLGLMQLLGYELDPYSILVPFLIFAIGLSHGAQKMNGILQDVGRGTHKYVAARYTYRRLFMAGLTALLTNIVGFAVLVLIDIPVIRDLAITASIGVTVLIFTKLVLIPVTLSYIGVSAAAAERSLGQSGGSSIAQGRRTISWAVLDRLTERRGATVVITLTAILTAASIVVMQDLRVGDIHPGAPELHADSRYNQDNAFVTGNFGRSSEQFAVIMVTPEDGCARYGSLRLMDELAIKLRDTEGVQLTSSLAESTRFLTSALVEGSGKWLTLSRDQELTNAAVSAAMIANPGITNTACSVSPLIAYLSDRKADTLARVLHVSEEFANRYNSAPDAQEGTRFLLAAGSAGIEAATNIEVKNGLIIMYLALYGATALLCLLTFRSLRATTVAMVPLIITTLLCKALMVELDIGLKVATLPVMAVGVGVGVDYALYLLSVQLALQRRGATLVEAYRKSLEFTGRVVALIGLTMAAGVITWAWSPIKFQADMGILLAFMFLWNLVGALILIPALSHFLLNPKRSAATKALPATA